MDENFIQIFANVMKLVSVLLIIAIIYAILFIKISPQKLVVTSVIFLGVIYIFILTPFCVPDEQYHYRSTMKLSNILTLKMDDENAIAADYTDYRYLIIAENSPEAYLRIKDPLFTDQTDLKNLSGRYHENYLVQYIPQALGVTLAKAFHLNFIWLFYMGRLFNLIFFAICAYIAVKKMPFQKYLVVLIAIMPMSLQLAASLSYDTFINGLSIVLVASIIESIYKKGPIAVSEIIWIAATAALLAPTKNVYCLLVFLAIFIPKERFSSEKSHLLSKVMMIGSGFAAILLISLPVILNVMDSRHITAYGDNSHYFTDILHHPVDSAALFFLTIKERFVYWILTMIGLKFGVHMSALPSWIFCVYALLLALMVFIRDTDGKFGDHTIRVIGEADFAIAMKMKVTIFFLSTITLLLVMLSMYLWSTSAEMTIIRGVQGRYLIPLLLPTLLILKNQRFKITSKMITPLLCAAFVLHFIIFNYGLVVTLSGL